MRYISNGYVADDLGYPMSTLNDLNFYILHCLRLCVFVIGDRKDSKFDVMVECASHSLRKTNCP